MQIDVQQDDLSRFTLDDPFLWRGVRVLESYDVLSGC